MLFVQFRCIIFTKCLLFRSPTFRPSYARLNEIRALIPPGVPMVALTATVTRSVKADVISKLELGGCKEVSVSPNRDNIYYEVRRRDTIESDFAYIISTLKIANIKATRTIVYCRTKNMCADLYQYFHRTLGEIVITLLLLLQIDCLVCSMLKRPITSRII